MLRARSHGGQQLAGVLVLRPLEEGFAGAGLHDPPVTHDRDEVADVPHDREVVGDEEVGETPSSACRSMSRLRIWPWTETSRAETGSSQMMRSGSRASARAMPIRCSCPPENDAGRRSPSAGVDAHTLEQLIGPATTLGAVVEAMDDPRFGHDVAGPEAWVDRGEGILVDELHVSAHRPQGRTFERHEVLAAEGGLPGIRFNEPQQDPPGGRLARARLTHQSVRLAGLERDRDILHGAHLSASAPTAARERLAQPARVEQELTHLLTVTAEGALDWAATLRRWMRIRRSAPGLPSWSIR